MKFQIKGHANLTIEEEEVGFVKHPLNLTCMGMSLTKSEARIHYFPFNLTH